MARGRPMYVYPIESKSSHFCALNPCEHNQNTVMKNVSKCIFTMGFVPAAKGMGRGQKAEGPPPPPCLCLLSSSHALRIGEPWKCFYFVLSGMCSFKIWGFVAEVLNCKPVKYYEHGLCRSAHQSLQTQITIYLSSAPWFLQIKVWEENHSVIRCYCP